MFEGLTFFGIPIEYFLRFGEAVIVAIIALFIIGVVGKIGKKKNE
jgi:hypothetical protein